MTQGLGASSFRVLLDTDDQNTPGWKFSEYELQGVPLRVEIGPRGARYTDMVRAGGFLVFPWEEKLFTEVGAAGILFYSIEG